MRNLRAEINGDHHKWFWSVHFLRLLRLPKTLAVELPAPTSVAIAGKTLKWWLWLASGSLLPASSTALSTSLRRRRRRSSNPLLLDPHRLVLDLDWFLQRGCDDSYTRFHFCFQRLPCLRCPILRPDPHRRMLKRWSGDGLLHCLSVPVSVLQGLHFNQSIWWMIW